MSVEVIQPGDQVTKDPTDKAVWAFDWDSHIHADAELAATGTFTVTCVSAPREASPTLAVANVSFITGNRKVQFRLTGGRAGTLYKVAHHIVTNETPANERERSFFVQVSDL